MPFSGYLTPQQIGALVNAAVDSGLVQMSRTLHLQGIPKMFALSLPKGGNDLDQFQLDLIRLNDTERLADGSVPLVQFLRNGAMNLRLRGLAGAEEFERLANQIGNNVSGVPRMPDPLQLPEIRTNQAIIGLDEMVEFGYLAGGERAGHSVARLVVARFDDGVPVKVPSGAPWAMTGTGWLIAPRMLITNWHVINCRKDDETPAKRKASAADFAEQAKNTLVEFDYDGATSTVSTIGVDTILGYSEMHDYALLRLKTDPMRPPLRLRTKRVIFTAATYLPVNILQHPRGETKRVALRNNLVTGADDNCIRYFTDTDFGSSGSPVCDDKWNVVALHRGSEFVRGVNYQGKTSAYVNYGSQIQAVLDDVQATAPALSTEIAQGQL